MGNYGLDDLDASAPQTGLSSTTEPTSGLGHTAPAAIASTGEPIFDIQFGLGAGWGGSILRDELARFEEQHGKCKADSARWCDASRPCHDCEVPE